MLRLIARLVVGVLANAVGLLVASALLDGFSVNASSFVLAVMVFSAATVVLGPLVLKVAVTSASFLVGGISLITTLIGLIITRLLTDGLHIEGLSTWITATVIIWMFSMVANLILPLLIFRKVLKNNQTS